MKKNFLVKSPIIILFTLLNTTANTQTVDTIAQPEVTTSIATDTIASKKESLVNLLDFKTRKKKQCSLIGVGDRK